ncbi:bifunctional phosphopantothenoylcysteine decarboxylase/phosphopantothenate--cysteine ligase CoaBC [uncultured Imperialibacter sp.]|uniref:bifunctional phosphopantothenoylcysteine decarboxylase/phosphopantothenate--cysteine ligase CoaBC n=1 Tax=uncultured Imperialibacter sp. TaxID=1672639 RepID=UPI0030D8474E|tara:strand:+ start:20044 stop:21240 length:1197 start_codon:yes stop_codon:yes gene_type:complete
MLQGKKILLGVCGSIAAYKSALLTRLLVKQGAEVQVLLTADAKNFITPLTLSTLSRKPVYSDFFHSTDGTWNNHVELGLWADAMVIAPASANTLAKMANGICDNLLLATYLSARCPVFFAPAMDLDMYRHPSTTANIDSLLSYGNKLINAEDGELASGLSGVGRMAEPEHIVQHLEEHFSKAQRLAGKKVLITAGPTHEAIDPVRFIGNHSTGKMGFALAERFASQGATVEVVSGPSTLSSTHAAIHVTKVHSAEEMLEACEAKFDNVDIAVFAAAVADYRPDTPAQEKIKKSNNTLTLHLVKNPDIAATLGKRKKKQFTVGFALETTNEIAYAKEKLHKKNFNLIVLNSLKDQGAGFAHDTNKITILDHDGSSTFDLKSKQEVANDIVDVVCKKMGL